MSAVVLPPEPEVPEDQRARGPVGVRYEDVSQDGRLTLAALPHALGDVLWHQKLADHPMSRAVRTAAVVPVLTRLVVEGGDGPVSVRRSLDGEGSFQLAHTRGPDGAVDRLFLNMWVSVSGPRSRMHGPPPPDAGTTIRLGRLFAEHVFTRPFASGADRKVLSLPFRPDGGAGAGWVPDAAYAFTLHERILELPDAAAPLEPDLAPDPAVVALGLGHTDSNQHVNSLVYPRLFEEAVLRRLAALGEPTALLGRSLDIGYRKPSFAGDRLRIALRTFALGDRRGAVGVFYPEGGDPSRPSCRVRLVLGP